MNMQNHLDSCKRTARQIKKDYPNLPFSKRLDIAAKQQGFKHYNTLIKLYKLLGPDVSPTTIAIVMARGDQSDCPYNLIENRVGVSWSSTNSI